MPARLYTREQVWLLPPSLDDLLPDDHAARFVDCYVRELDLAALGIATAVSPIGAPSYDQQLLLKCWLYGFMTRVRSSRQLERACRENVVFMWLTGMQTPDHVTLWRFYKKNRSAMKELFRQTVRLAIQVGLVDFALQAIDGSKIPIASNDTLKQLDTMRKLLDKVEEEIAAMEHKQLEMPGAGRGDRRAWAKKEEQKERIVKAMAKIDVEDDEERKRSGKRRKTASIADPEAPLMKTRHGWKVAYNAQAMVDSKAQVIVAADVTDEGVDTHQLIPLMDQAHENTGRDADVVDTDAGFYSADNLAFAQERTDLMMPDPALRSKTGPRKWAYHKDHFRYDDAEKVYLCPQNKKLTYERITTAGKGKPRQRQYRCADCADCPVRSQCTQSPIGRTIKITRYEPLVQAHRAKMQTERARKLMKQRAGLVEPVFGIMKGPMGAARFLLRGLNNVRAEWHLLCAAFNLRKLYQLWRVGRLDWALDVG